MGQRKKFAVLATVMLSLSLGAFSQQAEANQIANKGWLASGGEWKHFDDSGKQTLSWLKSGDNWYYFNTETGFLLRGWQRMPDGSWYHFSNSRDKNEGKMDTGWLKTADGSWYFLNTTKGNTEGRMLSGWHIIDNYAYYFTTGGEKEGSLLMNTYTPDGKKVDADGRLLDSEGKAIYHLEKGISSIVTSTTSTVKGSSTSKSAASSSSGSSSSTKGSYTNVPSSVPSAEVRPEMPHGNTSQTDSDAALVADLFIDEQTKIISSEIGWARYVSIAFSNGSLNDYQVFIDGVEITEALTPVDDAKTIVKWMSTVSRPSKLKVVRRSDTAY